MKYWVEILLVVFLQQYGIASYHDGVSVICTDVRRLYNQCNVYENDQTSPVIRQRGKAGAKGEKGERGEKGPETDRAVIEQMVRRQTENTTNHQLLQKYENAMKIIEEHSKELKAIREFNAKIRPTDCSKFEPRKGNESKKIHEIYANWQIFSVSCDLTTGTRGWTIIQRRNDGSEDFFRNHADYVKGFGNVSGEFWLGLDNIYNILQTADQFELRIDMEDWDGEKRFAQYSQFDISGPTRDYTLSATGYSGNAGDSLSGHNGMKFTTKDHDVDTALGNCARSYKGAWWYGSCHSSNLNGLYHTGGTHNSTGDGVNWQAWKGYFYSLKIVEMKIRPVPK